MPRGGTQRSGPGQRSCSGGRQQAGGLYSRRTERDHTQRGGEGCSPPSGAPWGPTSSRPGRGRERARGLQRRGWKGRKKPACAGDATGRGPASPPLTASRTRPWRAGLGLCTGVRAVPSPWSQKAASGGLVVNLRHSFGQPDVSGSPLGAFGKGFCVFFVFVFFLNEGKEKTSSSPPSDAATILHPGQA